MNGLRRKEAGWRFTQPRTDMPKFFVPPEDIGDEELWIREDAHHLLHVLRQGPGDTVLVCDGEAVKPGVVYNMKGVPADE